MIVNYASSVINKLEALLTDDARVIIYDRNVFIVQATDAVVVVHAFTSIVVVISAVAVAVVVVVADIF